MTTTVPIVVPTVAEAAAAFLDTCTAPSIRRSYTQTMTRLTTGHGTAPVTALDGETLRGAAHHQLVRCGAGDVEPAPGHPRLLRRPRRPPTMA